MINKTNILIVDDEPGIRDTLYYNLTDAGYNVTTAESGIDAINKIRTKKFKAILSDIVMNDGDGIMLLKELKEQSKLLPVILFTGYASIDSSIDAVNFGAYAYLKKPISIEELKKVLNKAIEKYKEDTSKEKVFNKFLRTLIKSKKLKEEKMRKDGILENDIEIPANEKNFNLINQKMNKQIRNTNADILIITKNRVLKNNLENLLRYEKFKNVRTMETINSQLIKFHSIIIIDIDCFKRKFYEEYFKIIKTKPNIKVIAIASKENMHLLNKLKELGIKTVLQKPVGFDRILDVICWQSY
ncbi:MAG TPA: response regulator, partial [bacterium]|nr:response regulator [bacterium]